MTLKIEAGFDLDAFGSLKITVDAVDATVDGGTFCAQDLQSVIGSGSYGDLETTINAALSAAGITSISVAYQATGYYRINRLSGTPFVVFGANDADASRARMGQLLGFSTQPGTLSSNVIGDALPYFTILSETGGKTADSDDYEGPSYSEDTEAEDGTSYGIARTGRPIYADFTCAFEPRAVVYEREATTAVPWTWQHFYRHVSVVHPFLVSDDFGDETVHKLRAGSDVFKPRRVQQDWRELHDMELKTRVLGRL